MKDCAVAPLKPRERIISTARDLFRKHGIRGIGVDAIADVAGTNKMTLYRHFGSKDDLVVAWLREVARDAEALWGGFEAPHPDDPLAHLHAWVRCAPSARAAMAAAATWPMWRSSWPRAIIRRDTSSRNSRWRNATAWRGSAGMPGLRRPICSPTPCRCFSKVPA